ncbi:hypothetical protein QQ045_007781 [Rhodiola kirilowii]
MGNSTSGKVILPNGAVRDFHQPLTVAELMLEHPQHVMVEYKKSLAKGRSTKPSPLPADAWLDTKNVYLMVPVRKGKLMGSVTLSPKEVHELVTKANSNLMQMKLKVFISFPKMCSFMRKECVEECLLKRKRLRGEESVAEIWEEMPEYYNRRVSGRGWRPSLDTIIEKNGEKKLSHWLY